MAKAKKQVFSNSVVAKASLTNARIAPQKARLVLDLVRGKQVEPALQILDHSNKKGAAIVARLLRSAVANASEHAGADVDTLWVSSATADMARTLKRFLPRAQGRATKIRKTNSHIKLTLGEL